MEHSPALATQIRDARLAAGLSQQQLADALGVNLKTAGQWERTGAVPAIRMAKLRQVLPALGAPGEGEWVTAPALNGTRHLERLEMSLPITEPTLARLERLRRELSRIALEMDECLDKLARGER